MRRISWERLAALAGAAFVVLYVVAFVGLGIEVGNTDREILDYYASSSHRTKEILAFFVIAGAALSLLVFATALPGARARELDSSMLGSLVLAGGCVQSALILVGNAISRGAGYALMDKDFHLDPNTRRYFEDIGFLLFTSAALAGIVLVVGVSLAALRYALLPRSLGWAGFVVALLLPTAIAFVGFLVFLVWVLAVSVALALRRPAAV